MLAKLAATRKKRRYMPVRLNETQSSPLPSSVVPSLDTHRSAMPLLPGEETLQLSLDVHLLKHRFMGILSIRIKL